MLLKNNGKLILEIGHKQGKELSKYLNLNGFNQTKIYKDLSGKDRCLVSTKNYWWIILKIIIEEIGSDQIAIETSKKKW